VFDLFRFMLLTMMFWEPFGEDKHVAAFQNYRSNRSISLSQSAYLCMWLVLWNCLCTVTVFFFIFLLGLESITSVKGQRMTILVVSYLTYGFELLEKSVIVIRDDDVGYGWLVLIIMFYLILRFYYLYFGIFIFAHKFFRLVLCRLNYFNKLV
jgi:hypothetical protein